MSFQTSLLLILLSMRCNDFIPLQWAHFNLNIAPKSSSFYSTELSPDQENIARPPKAHFKNMKRLCLTETPNGFLSGLEIKRNVLGCFLKEKTIHFRDERLKSLVIEGGTWRNMGVQISKEWWDGIDVNLKGNFCGKQNKNGGRDI